MIRPPVLAVAGLLAGAFPLAAQQGAGFTFYQDGRVLARRTFEGQVPAGASRRALDLGEVDLGTLVSLDPAIRIAGARLGPGPDQDRSLRRSVGRELWWAAGKDTVRATLAGVDPFRVRLPDGSISFGMPGVPLFPPDLVDDAAALEVDLAAARARPAFPLAWYAQGGGWQATYTVVLGGTGASRVTGMAVVRTGSIEAEAAEVQLLAGNVGYEGGMPRPLMRDMAVAQEMAAAPSEQAVGEAHLYTLPGRHDLPRNAQLAVALFEAAEVRTDKRYTVSGAVPLYGPMPQYGTDERELPVAVTYVLPREQRTAFGDLPLPGGTWRLFEADREGRLQLVGVAGTGHEPAGQDVRLSTGTAFDLTARLVQETWAQRREGRATIATADYRVTLANAGSAAVTIDVLEQRAGEWSVLESSVPAERLSSTVVRFRVPVPAGGEATLTYRVEARW